MISRLAREVLLEGLDDWVPFLGVKGAARRLGAVSDAEQRRRSLATVRELAKEGLVEIGQVTRDGFSRLPESLPELLARLTVDAESGEADFLYWLSNTTRGDQEALAAVGAEISPSVLPDKRDKEEPRR